MATKAQAQAAIAKLFGSKQDRLDSWPAYLGNEDGQVTGSRTGYVYVRYPSSNSAAVEVYNGGVPEVAGIRVKVGYKPEQPNLIQALGKADVREEVSTTVLYGILQNHARQHFWTGSDPVFVDFHQITPLAVYASSGLTVSIYAGNIQRGAAVVEVPAQTLDLTSSVPGTVGQGRYTLITLDAAGLIDTFRSLHPEEVKYTWWDMVTRARERNIGWRLDYFFVTPDLKDQIIRADIHPEVMGSDHCPISLTLEL